MLRYSCRRVQTPLNKCTSQALLFLAVVHNIEGSKKEQQNEAAKKEMGSKAWFGKLRDPQGFL